MSELSEGLVYNLQKKFRKIELNDNMVHFIKQYIYSHADSLLNVQIEQQSFDMDMDGTMRGAIRIGISAITPREIIEINFRGHNTYEDFIARRESGLVPLHRFPVAPVGTGLGGWRQGTM
jgi:hypothetical protein